MENLDRNTEQQVWKRVFAQPQIQSEREDLRLLVLYAMELSAGYRRLAGILTGRDKERLRHLWEGEEANIACLRGIHRLSGGTEEMVKPLSAPNEPARKALEKSYHRTRRALTEYTARLADSEFGMVFQKMADRERDHCAILAELLGKQW